MDDFLSDFPGDEFFFANQSVMNVYSSQGTELKQLSGFFYPHMIASDNFLFVLNDGLKYQIYNKYFQLVKTDWLHDAGTEVLKLLEGNVISSTPEDEFVLVTRDYTSTYFVVLDKDFSVLYTYNYSGLVDDVVFNPQFNDSLVLSNSTNITVYPLSPIRNLDFYLNNSLIYSSNEYITSTKKVSGLLGYFVSYINSLTYLGNTSVDIPLSFDFVGDLSSILASFSLDFELNSSPLVQIEAYSGLASTSYLKAGTSYYTSGSKLRYNTSLIPFKITDVSGLLSYFGGPYSLYNERGILEGSCSDSSGSVANLGSVGENGVNIGCGLGYYVTSNRTYDFLMYGNSSVPLIASGASFSSSSLKDTRSSTLSVNASYSGLNFTNVYFKLTSLNTSDYGNFSLEVSNGSLSQTLDVGVQRDNCFYDAYLNGVDDILSSYYVANSFAGRTVYVCMQSLGSGLFDYHIVFSGLTYPNTFTLASVGLKDSPASVANIVSNVSSVSWGSNFSISGNYSDLGGDFVNLTLQFLNPSTSLWENYSTQALLSSNGNFSFDGVNLNSSFVSEQLYYRFLIQDIDNVSLSLKSESYSSLNELELSERQLDLSYLSGGDFSTALSVQVFDNLSFGALSGALCKFYFNNNGSYVLQTVSLSNSSGVCSFSLPSSYAAGDYYFYVVASLDGYLSLQSSVFTKTYKKNLSLLLDYDHALNRSSLLNISARLVDTDSNLVFDSGVSCLLYINDIFVASRSTNASGACDFSNVAFGCGYSVGIHNISFNVSGADSGKYFNPAFEVRDTVALQDVLSLELLSPNNSVSYDPLDVLNLSANVSDSCGNALSANNDFYWEYEELDSGDKSIISSKLHDTWIVPSDVYGSILLRAVYQNASYGVQLENSTLLTVQDVLNIAYLGSDTFLRLPGQVTNLDAQIVTGNGIYVNESSYEGIGLVIIVVGEFMIMLVLLSFLGTR